ncbi:MAG TPA: exo-alpha-sialidase, partial [bacterium]|nr:exo-alpha-sialidase [bacterium]
GIRARISKDEGQTWDPEIILRCDGASWDLGYPRTVQRPDGKCVTVYYFHHPDQPERYIGCTIWDPNADYDN